MIQLASQSNGSNQGCLWTRRSRQWLLLFGLSSLSRLLGSCTGESSVQTDENTESDENAPTAIVRSAGGNLPSSSGSSGRLSTITSISTLAKTSTVLNTNTKTGTGTRTDVGTGTKIASETGTAVDADPAMPTPLVSDKDKSILIFDGQDIVKAGSLVLLRFKGISAKGEPLTKGGEVISFSLMNGLAVGEFGPTIDQGDGTYSTTFFPKKGAEGIVIGAKIGDQQIKATTPPFQIVAGDIDLKHSLLTIQKSELQAGTSTRVRWEARDAFDNPLGPGGLTPSFALADGSSTGVFSSVVDLGNGTYESDLLAVKSGTPTAVAVTVGGQTLVDLTSSPRVRVVPGIFSPVTSTVEVDGATLLSAGSTATLSVVLRDSFGNHLTSGGQTLAAALGTDGTSTLQLGTPVDLGNGTYIFSIKGEIAGTPTSILVSVAGTLLTSVAPHIQVVPGPLSLDNSVVALETSTLGSGLSTTVTLTLKDTFNNTVPDGLQLVAFETFGSGTSTLTFGAVSYAGSGVYQANVMGVLAGTPKSIRATIAGQTITTVAPTLSVIPGAISLSQSTVTINGGVSILASGSSVMVTLTGRDAAGNLLTVGGASVSFETAGTGTSSGTFSIVNDLGNGRYTATFTGQFAGTAVLLRGSVSGQALTSTAPSLTVLPGSYSLVQSVVSISGGMTHLVSGSSTTVMLTAKDAFGNQLATGGLNVNFVFTGGTSTFALEGVTDHGDGTYSMLVTGVLKGTAKSVIGQINAAPLTSPAPQLTVTQGPLSLATSTTTVSLGSINAGQASDLIFTARDAAGNVFSAGGLIVDFSLSGNSQGSLSPTNDGGNGTYTAVLTGESAGSASTIDTYVNGSLITSVAPTIMVTPGSFDPELSTARISSNVILAGTTSVITVILRDSFGNQLTAGGNMVTCTLDVDGTSTISVGAVNDVGNGTYTIMATGQSAGSPATLIVAVNGIPLTSNSNTIQVQTGMISPVKSTLMIDNATVVSGLNYQVTLTAKDAAGNLIGAGGATVAFAYSGGTSTAMLGSVVDGGDGTYTASLTGISAGTATTLTATINGVAVTSLLPTFTVVPAASTIIELSGISSTPTAGQTQTMTLTLKDINGNVDTNYLGTVNVTTTDPQATITPSSYTFANNDHGTKNFSVTFKTSGIRTITAMDAAQPLVTITQSGIAVQPASAAQVTFGGVAEAKAMMCSSSLQVQVQDTFGNLSPVSQDKIIELTGKGSGTFYSDAGCTSAVTALQISAGSSTIDLYFLSNTPENLSLLASASGLVSIGKNFSVKAYQAWLGSFATLPVLTTGGHALRGRFDGMMNGALAMTVDSENYFYIADSSNHRIVKYDAVYGLSGWIGGVFVTPTGGASGCETATTATSGWCLGGFARSGTGDGQMIAPGGVAIAGSYLYVADTSNHRIQRFDANTGSFAGWSGRILTSPTGGATGCAGAAVGTTTPGWCFGGTAQSGTGMGQYNLPRNLLVVGNYLYISDNTNHRIARMNLSSGVMDAWIGLINTSPTAGVTGCNGAAPSTVTPGWCIGGTSKTGTVMGSLKNQRGLATDGMYLYVADTGNHRIQRYVLASGAIDSWIGRVGANPTGGAPGCSSAGVNNFTPGWCINGAAKSGTGNGAMSSPYSVAVIGSELFVADYGNNRINKYVLSAGGVLGWIGRVSTVPTGGTPGCTTTAVGEAASGWCLGGTAQSGIDDGMFYGPADVQNGNASLLVVDSLNYRMAYVDPATGNYSGWLGARSTAQSTWSISPTQPNLSGRDNESFYNPLGLASDGVNLFVADGSNHRIKNYAINPSGLSFTGWVGAVWGKPTAGGSSCTTVALSATTPTWCSGGSAKTGTSNGQFNVPNDIYVDSTHIYVVDKANHRIQKFIKSTGAFVGWIGRISTPPTGGDPGCIGAGANNFTPGWCSGGTAKSGAGDGHLSSPQGVFGDNTYLYVADSGNNRVVRYTKTNGAFGGWLGRVLTVPTGGASGCSSAVIGNYTPGWCTGGTAQTGTGDGSLSTPIDVTGDGLYLYVSDSGNHRLLRYEMATGVYQGWLGRILTSPTGGGAGCAGAAVGTSTPGYCTGGTAQFGSGDGHLRTPRGLWTNGVFVYVVDGANHRIVKLTTGGSFAGWQGKIGVAPTAGDTGCMGSAAGTLTPDWCRGGSASRGDGMGMFDTPMFITGLDGKYLIITQINNSLLTRIPL